MTRNERHLFPEIAFVSPPQPNGLDNKKYTEQSVRKKLVKGRQLKSSEFCVDYNAGYCNVRHKKKGIEMQQDLERKR